MIRLSHLSDYKGLISLWQEAFGDSEEAIRLFLDSRYNPDNTVVAEENGRIISMLFLLEGKLNIKGKDFSSYYLYAAATAKSHRGKGFMSELLAYAENIASNRNVDFICLKPAEDSLYGYYSKYGYKTVFSVKSVRVNSFDADISSFSLEEKIDWETARNNMISESDAFLWDNSAIGFAIKQHLYYGGKILFDCNGYCLYTVKGNKCCVKEFCFTQDNFDIVISSLINTYRLDEIIIDLPVNYQMDFNGVIKNNGMALAVTESAKSVVDKIKNAYLGLTLD